MNVNLVLNIQTTGTGDAMVATYSPAFASLVNGKIYAFIANAANTVTNPTININGLGAKVIKKDGNAALVAGDISAAAAQYFISYRLTGDYFELVNPKVTSGGGENLAQTLAIDNKTGEQNITSDNGLSTLGAFDNGASVGYNNGGNTANLTLLPAAASIAWSDGTSNAQITMDASNAYFLYYDGALGKNANMYLTGVSTEVVHDDLISLNAPLINLPSVTASRLLSTDSSKNIVPITGTGFVKVTAGVISYDTSTYLTSAVTSVTGTANEISSTGGNTPVLSLPTALTFTGKTVTGGTYSSPTFITPTTDSLTLTGNISAPAWTTAGVRIKGVASTFTDTTSSGTVATAYTTVLGANTIAASSVTTFTNYFANYVNDPVAGANVTMTNKWAIGADSAKIGTSNQMTISNAGIVAIGAPTLTGRMVDIKQDTAFGAIGSMVGGTSDFSIYALQSSPSATNYTLSSNGNTSTVLNAPTTGGSVALAIAGTARFTMTNTAITIATLAATSGLATKFTYTGGAHVTQTASAEVIDIRFNLSSALQHATGAITTQRSFVIDARTYSFVGASTITNAATLAISGAPIAGTNATITNSYALWVQGGVSQFDGNIKLTQTVTSETVVSDRTVTIVINGTTYKLLAKA